ncbi:MAG: ISAs1 family transposase, partial [Planctomycetales bacterium]|nr:ISAs1 family transposase [Planctomycetales bacterium]
MRDSLNFDGQFQLDEEMMARSITIFTWGYYGWGNHTPPFVEAVDAVETSRRFEPPIFVDIRIRRSVRAAGFTGPAFEKLLGQDRHRWMKSLGNEFIKTKTGPNVQIADPSAANELLDLALESAKYKQRLLFFCSCQWPRYDGKIACHRTTVARLVLKAAKKRGINLKVVEWPGGERNREVVAIDGKALRRSHDRRHNLGPLFLVSAWSVHRGISLGQLATAEKSNEITAIPELIEQNDLQGSIVTIDAAGCQKTIAKKIIEGGSDYVLALKGNQKSLYNSVSEYVTTHMDNDFATVAVRRHEMTVKGHGRVDTLIYYQMPVPNSVLSTHQWPGLRTIGVAIRISEQNGNTTSEVRYYISSLRLGVKQFAQAVRGHWSI